MSERTGAICGACGQQVPLDGASCRHCGHSFIGDLVGAGVGRASASSGRRLPEAVTRRHKAVLSGLVVDEDADHVDDLGIDGIDGIDQFDGPPTALAAPPVPTGRRPATSYSARAAAPATGPAIGPATGPALTSADDRDRGPEPEAVDDDVVPVRRPGRVLLVIVAVLLVLVVAVGGCLFLVFRPGSPQAVTGADAGPSGAGGGAAARSWTSTATAKAPVTSPDSKDSAGQATSYAASQMLDGDLTTAWRQGGDGAGTSLTFDLGAARSISELGLVNGYAKVDPSSGTDRYTQERRITKVTWIVDGHSYPQALTDSTRTMQVLQVGPVTASTVELRIDATTAPGDPAFDKTAISEVRIAG